MYPDDDMLADDGYVELPPPPVNPHAGFWRFGALQLLLVSALDLYVFVTRTIPEPEPGLDGIILSSIEAAPTADIASPPAAVAPVEVPIPRMRELADDAPPQGWVIDRQVEPAPDTNAPIDADRTSAAGLIPTTGGRAPAL
jgi:hypothetical protein